MGHHGWPLDREFEFRPGMNEKPRRVLGCIAGGRSSHVEDGRGSAQTSCSFPSKRGQTLTAALHCCSIQSDGRSFSGEIAAAYAADFLSAHDAIRIAYYRGFHTWRASGCNGQKGAILAVGTSWEDATELVELPAFEGRAQVAAHNSSASVTLAGDTDAIAHLKMVFDEEKKFARILQFDTAYHSQHKVACSAPYAASLHGCNIQQFGGSRRCSTTWYSSVYGGKAMGNGDGDALSGSYWVGNMLNPVRFLDALTAAAAHYGELNLAIEIGPHPALKGPVTQTINSARPPLPYCGLLSRGVNDIEAVSDGLGFIWTQLGRSAVDFDSFDRLFIAAAAARLLTGLPTYKWDRRRVHWHESRQSKLLGTRPEAFHELLGVKSRESTARDWRWTNLLKQGEIHWLSGHQLQGQVVFPAAGYVAMALEAAPEVASGRGQVSPYEVHDLSIGRAITSEEDPNLAWRRLLH